MAGEDSKHAVFMQAALEQAELALNGGEIPVGCVFVNEETGVIVSSGHNRTNDSRNGTKHAELVAMDKLIFCNSCEDFDALSKCSLYVSCANLVLCARQLYC